MKAIIATISFAVIFVIISCSTSNQTITHFKIKNLNNFDLKDAYLEIDIAIADENFIIRDGIESIPYQVISSESNKQVVGLVINLRANEIKTLSVMKVSELEKPKFKSRTYAELSMKSGNIYHENRFRGNEFLNVTKIKVPSIHTDHDALFKYEGPGWESEKVGYRFYLDWRNAIDIFGKKKDQLILAQVGVYDTVAKDDSYHSMQEWGMDIFKVGSTLGIGSFGMFYNDKVNMVSKTDSVCCEIPMNGPIISEVKTNYFGWEVGMKKFNLESRLLITAGSRLTKNELTISDNPENLVTGLAKYPGTNFFKSNTEGNWHYIALYGNQTLVSDTDKLGIALFYNTKDLEQLIEDDFSYVVKLKPYDGKLSYYFCAAWEQEEFAINNLDDFKKYLEETRLLLNKPLEIEIIK